MSIRSFTAGAVGFFCLLCLGWIGCSTNSGSSVGSPEAHSIGDIARYFPLDEGYSTFYRIRHCDGTDETATFKVGREVIIGGTSAVEWLSSDDGGIDTSYFEVTDSAIYYYRYTAYPREKILQLPLEPGNSWSRYSDSENDTDTDGGFTDIITGDDDDYKYSDTTTDNTDLFGNSFPTIGSGTMTVEQIERLQLSSGEFYGRALRVSNAGAAGTTNYYWYVSGVGLAKYVIGATSNSYPEGKIVGELVLYGY